MLKAANPDLNEQSVRTIIFHMKGKKTQAGTFEGGRGVIGFFPNGNAPLITKAPLISPAPVATAPSQAVARLPVTGLSSIQKTTPKPIESTRATQAPKKPPAADYKDGTSVNGSRIPERYRGYDSTYFSQWWDSLWEAKSPEGDAVRHMERALGCLSGEDRSFVLLYLSKVLRGQKSADSYVLQASDFRRAAIVADAAQQFSNEKDVFYAALRVLNPTDDKTAYVLGESLSMARRNPGKGLAMLRNVGMQKDTESAYATAKKHIMGY